MPNGTLTESCGNKPPEVVTIFGAEDEQMLRKMLARITESIPGFQLGQIFPDGVSLIAHLEMLQPDELKDVMILTDFKMPGGVNGADIAAWAMEHELPYLVFTGTSGPYLEELGKRVSREQFDRAVGRLLLKPARLNEVTHALQRIRNEHWGLAENNCMTANLN